MLLLLFWVLSGNDVPLANMNPCPESTFKGKYWPDDMQPVSSLHFAAPKQSLTRNIGARVVRIPQLEPLAQGIVARTPLFTQLLAVVLRLPTVGLAVSFQPSVHAPR